MKLNKKIMTLLIQILIVTLALVLTVSTYAWYASNRIVHVSQTTVTSAAGANTTIDSETNPEWDLYQGQDGTDTTDNAPYIIDKTMTVTFTPMETPSYVFLNLKSIVVHPQRGSAIDSAAYILDPTADPVIPNFTWRLEYGGHTYLPGDNGFAYYDNNGTPVYLEAALGEGQSSVTMTNMVFHLVFLSEESYVTYLENVAGSVEPPFTNLTPFAYSDYSFMRAVFNVTFEIGVDIMPAVEP